MEKLSQASLQELLEVDGIDETIAKNVITFFHDERNIATIERLRTYGLQMALSAEQLASHSEVLKGKSIVISGVFSKHSRDEYKVLIEQNGGKNVSSISSKTSFILAGENMGPSKLEKAQKLAIPLMSEEEFLALLNKGE